MAVKINGKNTIVNDVEIRGNIVRINVREGLCVVTVATGNPVTKETDFPSFLIFDKTIISDIVPMLEKGVRVTAHCEIQTRKEDKNVSLICTDINVERTRLDAAFDAKEYRQDTNTVMLQGTVQHIYEAKGNCTLLTLFTRVNQFSSNPTVVCFGNNAAMAANLKNGDEVKILGYIQTKIKNDENNKRVYYQSIVAQSIKKN